jgi:hypothetical protein
MCHVGGGGGRRQDCAVGEYTQKLQDELKLGLIAMRFSHVWTVNENTWSITMCHRVKYCDKWVRQQRKECCADGKHQLVYQWDLFLNVCDEYFKLLHYFCSYR